MFNLIRRGLLLAGLSMTLATGALGLHGEAHAQATGKTIRIALQPAPLLGYYVRDMKLLEKRGFKPEWIVMPFSPPILEGMAAGCAVVGSRVPGVQEIIAPGVNGLLAEPRDPQSLADALESLLRDDTLAATLGAQARRQAFEHYGLARMADDYAAMITQIMR